MKLRFISIVPTVQNCKIQFIFKLYAFAYIIHSIYRSFKSLEEKTEKNVQMCSSGHSTSKNPSTDESENVNNIQYSYCLDPAK